MPPERLERQRQIQRTTIYLSRNPQMKTAMGTSATQENLNYNCHQLPWWLRDFPGNSAGKESACNAGDPGSIPGSGRSDGEGIDYPLQYSGGSAGKEPTCNVGDLSSIPGLGRSPGEKRLPTPVFWPGESHGLCVGPQRVGHD